MKCQIILWSISYRKAGRILPSKQKFQLRPYPLLPLLEQRAKERINSPKFLPFVMFFSKVHRKMPRIVWYLSGTRSCWGSDWLIGELGEVGRSHAFQMGVRDILSGRRQRSTNSYRHAHTHTNVDVRELTEVVRKEASKILKASRNVATSIRRQSTQLASQ